MFSGVGGYCFYVEVGQQRGSIYLFMISDPLSSVIEIEDLGIRQPNQSLPLVIWQDQDLRCFSSKILKQLGLNMKACPGDF